MMTLETIAVRPKKMLMILLCLSDADEGRGELSVEFVVDCELAIGDMIFVHDFVCGSMRYVGKD